MNFNFELILFYLVLFTAALTLVGKRIPLLATLTEFSRGFFPILLLVFTVRSFAYEGYRIPSGSLKPTLLVGDFILTNKYEYGLRLPVIHTKILSISEPKRGDIVVFREPPKEARNLIKRVIGLPGDHIRYQNKTLYINDQIMPQTFVKLTTDQDHPDETPWQVMQKTEILAGVTHNIYQTPARMDDDFDVVVPAGHYFMMGDNRDDSADSRVWGFLPEKNIIGRATRVVISYDTLSHPLRLERTASKII